MQTVKKKKVSIPRADYTSSPICNAKGAFWGDKNTAPIHKFANRKPKRKTSDPKTEMRLTETEDITLRNELRRSLQSVRQRNAKALLPSLRALDPEGKRKLPFDKVRFTLQKNQISLSEIGFRNLGKKFGERVDDRHIVRYEKLTSYLTKLWEEAAALPKNKPTTPPATGFSNMERIGKSRSYVARTSYISREHVLMQGCPRDVDGAQLVTNLQQELSNLSSLVDLREKFYNFDLDETGFVNEGQVYASFQSCNVYLSPEVFQHLLNAVDETYSNTFSIDALITYLLSVRPDLHYQGASGSSRSTITNPSGQWTPSEYQVYLPEEVGYAGDEDYSEARFLPDQDECDSFDEVQWSNDFQALVSALRQADDDKKGFLEEDEVRRIAQRYILVHNLGISNSNLSSSLQEAYDQTLREVNLDYFANILEERHFKAICNSF